MALIPSESLNFPDSFRSKVGWHISDKSPEPPVRESSAAPLPFPEDPNLSPAGIPAAVPRTPLPGPAVSADLEPPPVAPSEWLTELSGPAAMVNETTERDPGSQTTGVHVSSGADIAALLNHIVSAGVPTEIFPDEPPKPNHEDQHKDAGHSNGDLRQLPELSAPSGFTDTQQEASTVPENPSASEAADSTSLVSSLVDSEMGSQPVSIQTAVQAQQLFQILAAAVQRGTLAGETVSEAPAGAATPVDEPPTVIPSQGSTYASPELAPAKAPEGPDGSGGIPAITPAKIRIVPRKMKARPAPTAELPPASGPGSSEPSQVPETSRPIPSQSELRAADERKYVARRRLHDTALATAAPKTGRPKLAKPRPPFAPDLLATPGERRKRWIGFGLSETAAVAAVLLLGRFGFTHHFPDPTVKLLVFVLLFAATALCVALPIAFFRNDPARWQR